MIVKCMTCYKRPNGWSVTLGHTPTGLKKKIVMTTELSAGCHGSVILIDSVVDLLQCLIEHQTMRLASELCHPLGPEVTRTHPHYHTV